MLSILVQSREPAPRADSTRPQGAPQVVPNRSNPLPQGNWVPQMPVALSHAARGRPATAPLSIGSLLYLGSVGLIAAGIAAIFFGAGFSLLVPAADGTTSAMASRAGPASMSPSPVGNNEPQTAFAQASALESNNAAQSFAVLPAAIEGPAIDSRDDVPQVTGVSDSKAPTDTPVAPANAPASASNLPASTALPPRGSELSITEMTELLDHGDSLLRNGDIASARLFYERAAGAGDGRAALRLGATFDPEFLARFGLARLQANLAEAQSWYDRALDLGAVDARPRLNSFETRQGK
jgi:hypothetical protein